MRSARIAEQETASLDDLRLAQAQILKDLRGAVATNTAANSACISEGAPVGYCLQLYYQSPSGTLDQIRYRAVQIGGSKGRTTLYRDTGCDPSFICSTSREFMTNLGNREQNVPMFTCDTTSSYPQITITLVGTPLSEAGKGTLRVETRARPRNIRGTQC
jgi:hypothetical protein